MLYAFPLCFTQCCSDFIYFFLFLLLLHLFPTFVHRKQYKFHASLQKHSSAWESTNGCGWGVQPSTRVDQAWVPAPSRHTPRLILLPADLKTHLGHRREAWQMRGNNTNNTNRVRCSQLTSDHITSTVTVNLSPHAFLMPKQFPLVTPGQQLKLIVSEHSVDHHKATITDLNDILVIISEL